MPRRTKTSILGIIAGGIMMGRALHMEFWDWTWFMFGLAAFVMSNILYWTQK